MAVKEHIKAIIKQYTDKGERLYNESCETKEDSQTIGYWDGYRDCANLLLRELNDMQEEPKDKCKGCNNVKGCITCVDGSEWAHIEECNITGIKSKEATGKLKELLDNMKDSVAKDLGLSEEDYNKAIDECIYGKEPELVDDGDLPKEETVSEKECMYSKDNYTAEDRKVLCDGCEEECKFNKKEEPVSEDLDFIATRNALAYVNNINRGESPWLDSDMELAYEDGMKAGANWQKQQMMANAVDIEVKVDAGGYPCIPQMELYDYDKDIPLAKEGDKYKLILIKEE